MGIRAFFALPVRDADRPALLDAQRRMKRAAGEGRHGPRWTSPEQLHVTLKFLGDVSEDSVQTLLAIGAQRAAEHAAFDSTWTEVTGFGSVARARVLVVGVSDPSGDMARLAADIEADVEPLGVARETRSFVPHVTLARQREPRNASYLVQAAELEAAPAHFDELVLYRSELGRAGAVYSPLGRWSFTPGREAG
jgi:2'-5' RNA ligase